MENSSLPKKGSPLLRLNTICPYFTMFPLEFPFNKLKQYSKEALVLDPFCGRGTTSFAARLLGLTSVAVDSNPVAYAVSSAKYTDVDPRDVIDLCNSILADGADPLSIPSGEFWRYCYHKDVLVDLCKIREYLIQNCDDDIEKALKGLMLGILHGPINKGEPSYLSNQMPRTYSTKPNSALRYWKARDMRPVNVNLSAVVARRAWYTYNCLPDKADGFAIKGDSRNLDKILPDMKFDIVITSPPYYGMRTYNPDQWLRAWFAGEEAEVNYSEKDQVTSYSLKTFTTQLSLVWQSVAKVCNPNAKLVVRFGAIPSIESDPSDVLKASLNEAKSDWRINTIKDAGTANSGNRQANQFKANCNSPYDEIDLYATLES